MIERQNGTDNDIVTLLTTFKDAETARQIGTLMIKSQLAACVNVFPGVESIYRWQGKAKIEAEAFVMVKTTRALVTALEAWLQTHHPYELPEILILSPEAGSARYLQWVRESVRGSAETPLDKGGS